MSFHNYRAPCLWLALNLLAPGVFASPDDPSAPVPAPAPFQSVLSQPSDNPPQAAPEVPASENEMSHAGHEGHARKHGQPDHHRSHGQHHGEPAS